jgi:4-amino-4-deoxy-L-arabinose transferase-like glycosyltransferase
MAWRPLCLLAALRAALPLLSTLGVPLGYSADELYYLACADRLAFGYVDHPPLSVAVLAGVRAHLGDSLLAIRLLPALCEAAALLVSAALARELGGGRRAQLLAALAFAAAPLPLAVGFGYSMNAIEHLLWPLAALVLARLLRGGDPRGWLVLGAILGLALANKLSTLWLGAGIALALVATPARRTLARPGPWLAAGVAALLVAPHLAWQAANGWPTLEFARHNASARVGADAAVVKDSPLAFLASQFVGMGPLAAPLWLAGLVHLLRARGAGPERALGWIFLAVLGGLAASGRAAVHYAVGVFPIALAAGAVVLERARARRLVPAAALALAVEGVLSLPLLFPVLPPERYLALAGGMRRALGLDPRASLPPHFEYMRGWPELVAAAGEAARTLSPDERARAGVLATTFGEAGALARLGPAAGLPPVVGTHNSFWLWGPRGLDGDPLLVVADEDSPALARFAACGLAARVACRHCEPRLRGRPVFVCRGPRRPLAELWPELKDYS